MLPAWGIVYQPLGAVLFLTAAIAENKRIPFDLPEAESELIAGYYTEYTSMKMGLFMFAEFIEIAIIGALFTTLFLGGYNLPYMNDAGFAFPGGATIALGHGAVVVIQLVTFLVKVLLVCSFQILDPLVAAALPLRPGAAPSRGSSCCRSRSPTSSITAVLLWSHQEARCEGRLPAQALLERADADAVGARLPARDHARPGHHQRRLPAQHGRWITGRKGALTTYYPEETRADYAPLNRGKHMLTQRPDGKPQCIACNMCATVCPAKVIEIEAGFDPTDAAHPKFPIRFEIDYSRCIFCGLCVEACPEDAIRMAKETPGLPVGRPARRCGSASRSCSTWQPQQRRRQALSARRPPAPAGRPAMIETLLATSTRCCCCCAPSARWSAPR